MLYFLWCCWEQQSTLTGGQNTSGWNKKGSCRLEGTWRGLPLPTVHVLLCLSQYPLQLGCGHGSEGSLIRMWMEVQPQAMEMDVNYTDSLEWGTLKWSHCIWKQLNSHDITGEPLSHYHLTCIRYGVTHAPSVVLDETTETLGLVLLTCKMACWKW